jgi:hypothetical protein
VVEEVRETFVYFPEAGSVGEAGEARVCGNSEFGDVKTNNPIPPRPQFKWGFHLLRIVLSKFYVRALGGGGRDDR